MCIRDRHYIQKVALAWSDGGITTVAQAKEQSACYHKNCYTILNAFGIKGRGPAASELSYIKKWTETLGFSLDIIQEACRRTIAATHQPSFEYTDSILSKWQKANVKHLKDILTLDEDFLKKKSSPVSYTHLHHFVPVHINTLNSRYVNR